MSAESLLTTHASICGADRVAGDTDRACSRHDGAVAASRTRLSLFYVLTYLVISAVGLIAMPGFTQRMLLSDVEYDPIAMRFAGVFILGLAIIVLQTIRLRLDALYPTLIVVRVVFCAMYVVMFAQTRNPFFLVVFGIVGAGLVASSIAYALDRR
jgi:hypothetical protein